MARAFTPKVVTANDLIEGDVVYLCQNGNWVRDLAQAWLIDDQVTAETTLTTATAQENIIVGAYLADAQTSASGPKPVHFRETFRATGPSNRFDGKQASQNSEKAVINV